MANVLVIGDVMLDRYVIGSVERVSQEAPVPVVKVKEERLTLGGAANVANNLVQLGAAVTLGGMVGDDIYGTEIGSLLNRNNVNARLIVNNGGCTITKTRLVAHHQQIARVDREEFREPTLEEVDSWFESISPDQYDFIVVSDYNKGFCSGVMCRQVINWAKEKGIRVLVDPKGIYWEKYSGAYMVTPNFKEFTDLAGNVSPGDERRIVSEAQKIINAYRFDNLLITRSERGMTLVDSNRSYDFPTTAKEVFDVSGAGDTVVAVVGYLLSRNFDLYNAISIANEAAGYVIGKFGTYAISYAELEKLPSYKSLVTE